jgi:hypothetical protein
VVACQEHLDVVAAVRPSVPYHAHVGGAVRVVLPPVAEQVVDDGVQPFPRGVPRLEQIVIKPDVVDRLDGHVGVGVRREQQELRARRMSTRLLEHLDTGHSRHALVRGDQRHRLVAEGEPGQHGQRLGPRRSADDAVVGAVLAGQVAGDRRGDLGIVVDRQDGRFAYERRLRASSPPARRRLEEPEPAAQA